MPIPQSIDDLDINPANNSPQPTEIVGPTANGYLQALGAFIKRLSQGTGLKPIAALDMNAQKITNVAAGTVSATSTDVLTAGQVVALAYKVGEQRMWHGPVASIATVWGAGWQLADGTNGTADCRDKFIVGAGGKYDMGKTGGEETVTLAATQIPAHGHAVNDPGHAHGVNDPTHAHGVGDPGHSHGVQFGRAYDDANWQSQGGRIGGGQNGTLLNASTAGAGTGIWINGNYTGVSIRSSGSGISVQQNTGGGQAHNNLPPYYASCIIEYTGVGA